MRMPLLLCAVLWTAPLVPAQSVVDEPAESVPAFAASGVAEQLPALALLPQRTESFISVGHPAALAEKLGASAENVREASDVLGAAVGFSEGSAESLRRALPLLHLIEMAASDKIHAEQWMHAAHERSCAIIGKQSRQHVQDDIDMGLAAMEQWHLPPVYAVVTVRPEAVSQLQEWQRRLVEKLSAEPNTEPLSVGAWKGVRLHATESQFGRDWQFSQVQKARLAEALKRFSLCVICTVREHSLVIAVCSVPEEAQPAISSVSSVLSAEYASFLTAHPNLFAAAYLSPSLQALRRDAQLQSLRSLFGFSTGVFKTLSVEDVPASETYRGAVNALAFLQEQAENLCPEQRRASTTLAWEEGDCLRLECESDACGSRFLPAESVVLPEESSRFFSFASDPWVRPHPVPFGAVLQSCVDLSEGIAETLSNTNRENWHFVLMQYRLFETEQAGFSAAFTSCDRGLNGSWAVVADGKGEVPASLIGGSPAHLISIPRAAVWAGMRNRSELASAWEQALSSAASGLSKLGGDDSIFRNMPIASSQEGTVTLHSLSLPMCCPAFSPSVALGERHWVLSSSAVLGAQLASAPIAAPGPVGSARFCFRPQPLAELLHKMAAEESALNESAASASRMAEHISEVSGIITTTADDVLHLHVDLKLRR